MHSLPVELFLKYVTFDTQAIPGTECHVTFSAGVAVPQTGDTLEDVIQRADAAAYTAKRNGKNCVVAA